MSDGFQRDTNIPYCCKDRAMWGAAGGLGPTQVFLHAGFFLASLIIQL